MRMASADARFANCSMEKLRALKPGKEKQSEKLRVTSCILARMQHDLDELKPDPLLSGDGSGTLLKRRLATAASCPAGAGQAPTLDEFTMVPAAAAAKDGLMRIFGTRDDLVLGGVRSPTHTMLPGGKRRKQNRKVTKVDIVRWLKDSFTEDDFVALKMDVEGAEHAIVPKMIMHNASALVDVLLWECHPVPTASMKCNEMERRLKKGGVKVIFREPYAFGNDAARHGGR